MTEEVTPTPPGDPKPVPVDADAIRAEIKAEYDAKAQDGHNEIMKWKRKAQDAAQKYDGVDLDEYNRLKTDFGSMSGDDAAQLREAMAAAKTDEERKLLTERGLQGYIDHHAEKRLAATQSAHEKQVAELSAQRDAEAKAASEFQARLRDTMLKTAVLSAIDDKFAETAKADILAAVQSSVKYDDDEKLTFLHNGEPLFAEAGKPAEAKDWLSRMVEDRPHWLKPSVAARAPGSGGGKPPAKNPWKEHGAAALAERMTLQVQDPQMAARLKKEAEAA